MGNHALLADVGFAVILILLLCWELHGWPEDTMFSNVKLRYFLKKRRGACHWERRVLTFEKSKLLIRLLANLSLIIKSNWIWMPRIIYQSAMSLRLTALFFWNRNKPRCISMTTWTIPCMWKNHQPLHEQNTNKEANSLHMQSSFGF